MTNALDEYANATTTRNIDENVTTLPYDEKDDMESLKARLQRRKKPIYAGLAFLAVVVIGVTVGVSAKGSTTANTESAQKDTTPSTSGDATKTGQQSQVDSNAGAVQAAKDSTTSSHSSGWSSYSRSGSASDAGASAGQGWALNSTDGSSSTSTPTPTPTSTPTSTEATQSSSSGEALAYSLVDFDWTDASKWQYASDSSVSSDMVTSSGITLTAANSQEPIRTIEGWSGEKVVYIEWERTSSSDTNIWMLNTKLEDQFATGNGWPYWGELDLFEMFTQDASEHPAYDYSGFGGFSDVSSYGQLTMHMGPATADGSPCFCPASPSKSSWYDNSQPMTSGCTAQFSNDEKNSIAAVWGSDGNGQYIQLIQNPTITKGGKLSGKDTYDVGTGSGGVTSKIYNNAELFWGVPATDKCATAGGHDATSGFPFFESFRIILEEQKKGDSSASFTVTNIQIFSKN
ncbi:hypothetical protein PF005_g18099 [Phytophthora fragariae]|uniref:Uncharacterized protein n=1 Tax=Phytophthora fragariae TaxID=53985 RepID=A0A6A3X1N6_9STRA|nr:hypothetical protein PF003_g6724 [Phytophthora fragariae]KAE8934456.1 hypothetical protein PF009_g15568 [Phytophthora fragariae]KAE8993745.1 hypothetical protein PF011_g17010 [Phytophthora fragariae]KAE9093327.1 hypothetical protein PF007_g18171 [Phytophthora fragariae]KAE9093547.1 hypothetical protein PF010_g17438 [Phytophthora fragariae]